MILAIQVVNDCGKLPRQGGQCFWQTTRVGDYRVVYEIDDAHRLVRIMRVRHRREVYR